MSKRPPIPPALRKELEEIIFPEASSKELLSLFERLTIAYTKNGRRGGLSTMIRVLRNEILARMEKNGKK